MKIWVKCFERKIKFSHITPNIEDYLVLYVFEFDFPINWNTSFQQSWIFSQKCNLIIFFCAKMIENRIFHLNRANVAIIYRQFPENRDLNFYRQSRTLNSGLFLWLYNKSTNHKFLKVIFLEFQDIDFSFSFKYWT